MAVDPALLAALPLVADGNPASLLRTRFPRFRAPPEALNQAQPQDVQALHAEFVTAGATLLRSNTAHAQATRLEAFGLADRAEALNNSGSALARRAFGAPPRPPAPTPTSTVLATLPGAAPPPPAEPPLARGLVMGTLEPPPEPGLLHDPAWRRSYGEQIVYLSDTAVDFFLLQHVTRLDDALALTAAVKRASDAPVLAALSPGADGRTADGHALTEAAIALLNEGADALGLSCGPGPAALLRCLEPLLATGVPVAVLAGVHALDAAPYPGAPTLEPAAFAQWLAPLAGQGVAILGGCCGVGPAHIRALASAV